MAKQVDYYFTSLSPYTYLGHSVFIDIINRNDAEVDYKPVILGKVFASLGVLPIKERPVARQKYRLVELNRWATKRQLPLNLQPAYFPADPSLADKIIIALQHTGIDASPFLARVLAACWSEDKNIADEALLREILTELGIDADKIVLLAQSDATQEQYENNTKEAIDKGVLGAPVYMLNDEQFWGQDRLDFLEDALSAK